MPRVWHSPIESVFSLASRTCLLNLLCVLGLFGSLIEAIWTPQNSVFKYIG